MNQKACECVRENGFRKVAPNMITTAFCEHVIRTLRSSLAHSLLFISTLKRWLVHTIHDAYLSFLSTNFCASWHLSSHAHRCKSPSCGTIAWNPCDITTGWQETHQRKKGGMTKRERSWYLCVTIKEKFACRQIFQDKGQLHYGHRGRAHLFGFDPGREWGIQLNILT